VGRFVVNECNNPKVILVERGTLFGYNNLVVDFRNLIEMKKQGNAVVFDATHSVQLPGAGEGKSLGLKEHVFPLMKAAVAVGIDGLFMEVHENPEQALSDAESQISMEMAQSILNYLSSQYHGKSAYFTHEINNTMMIVLNTAEYLKSEIVNNQLKSTQIIQFLEKIEKAVHKLSHSLKN
jgi:hypothetical protein